MSLVCLVCLVASVVFVNPKFRAEFPVSKKNTTEANRRISNRNETEASKKPMGALTLPAWKSFFKKYLNRSAAHLLTEERPIDPGVTAMLEQFQAPSEHDIKVGPRLVGFG